MQEEFRMDRNKNPQQNQRLKSTYLCVHVMLALCRSSRQMVVADEELDGTDMVGELLRKRQRLTYQP
jgi:hypothetical protein